jgi:hypothetical protein
VRIFFFQDVLNFFLNVNKPLCIDVLGRGRCMCML